MENMTTNPFPQNGNPFEQVQPAKNTEREGKGLAVASLVLGLVSLIGICCCAGLIDIITIPLALIFGIISLVKKRSGTGLAITGIVTSCVATLILGTILWLIWPLLPHLEEIADDYARLSQNQHTIFPEYEKTGELPDFMVKYATEEPYTTFFNRVNTDIYKVMDVLLDQYKKDGTLKYVLSDWSLKDGSVTSTSAGLVLLYQG